MKNAVSPAIIDRIRQMEACFDALQQALAQDPAADNEPWFESELQTLLAYYEGGQWLYDYTLDEAGLLPPDLKRGVLSQDAVYNFMELLNR